MQIAVCEDTWGVRRSVFFPPPFRSSRSLSVPSIAGSNFTLMHVSRTRRRERSFIVRPSRNCVGCMVVVEFLLWVLTYVRSRWVNRAGMNRRYVWETATFLCIGVTTAKEKEEEEMLSCPSHWQKLLSLPLHVLLFLPLERDRKKERKSRKEMRSLKKRKRKKENLLHFLSASRQTFSPFQTREKSRHFPDFFLRKKKQRGGEGGYPSLFAHAYSTETISPSPPTKWRM